MPQHFPFQLGTPQLCYDKSRVGSKETRNIATNTRSHSQSMIINENGRAREIGNDP